MISHDFPFSGHHSIRNQETVTINSIDGADAFYFQHCIWYIWTFSTSEPSRIKIMFQEFDFEESEFLVIGDGLVHGEDKRLANFSGNELPSDVTSVSSSAWIMLQYNDNKCCSTPRLHVIIVQTTIPGNYVKISSGLLTK